MPRSRRRHHTIVSKPTPPQSPKYFYTLEESFAFENDPSVRVVYLTEKGIDLHAVFPEDAKMDYALRHGYSWYNIMTNPPAFMQDDSHETKRVCIVNTTEAALTAHAKAKSDTANTMHIATILDSVRSIPTSNRTQDAIVECVAEYLSSNNLQDVSFWDSICNILYSEGLLPEPPTSPLLLSAVPPEDSDTETIFAEVDDHNQSVGSIGSALEWVSSLFPISDMSWVPMD